MAKGLTRAIGISNFSITKTEKLLKTAKIVPAANQVELHTYFQQPKLQEYCDSKGENYFCSSVPQFYYLQHTCVSHVMLVLKRHYC